jgi:peptide/nickel transport system ATP-binding protein
MIMDKYPHELSGGMKQRVVIAASLIFNPNLIIADEPTTALDVVVQDGILQKIKELQKKYNMSIILISHNIALIAETCNKIAVMYGGKILEIADTISIFKDSHNPYTMSLINSIPSISGPLKKLTSISGSPPDLLYPPTGCIFHPRCPIADEICKEKTPTMIKVANDHYSQCHFSLDKRLKEMKFEY